MKYPSFCKSVIDVTKAPYFADNTGKTDCTNILRLAIDDCLREYVEGIEKTRRELLELSQKQGGGNVYIGAEAGKYIDGEIYVTLPKIPPKVKTLYFPDGTYLVSDTLCYSFDNLYTQQTKTYTCELCRYIGILGESRENTVIRLTDNAKGFEKSAKKAVVCFNKASKEDTETTNCAQMNSLEDITIDCGKGNDGAIGVLYASSNLGRIENVTVRSDASLYGIDFDYGSEACINSVTVSGFDYGIRTGHTSPLVLDNIDLSANKIAGILTKNGNLNCRNIICGNIPTFSFVNGNNGRYYCDDFSPTWIGDKQGAFIFTGSDDTLLKNKPTPKNEKNTNFEDWACVDDFGAAGDGVTDDTAAIQRAMNSGKEIILFGTGEYKIERTVKIPATVKTIDFRYADIIPGLSLIIGEMECMFEICEESAEPFFAEHFSSSERACGFYRIFGQTAIRTAIFKDICVPVSLYFNTVGGSEIYFDNCFTHTNHYAQDVGLHRDGYKPVFCKSIPVEVHGQKVYGKNLNIERAETELLNDNSEIVIDGYKVEGPGTLIKSVNGGKTQLNLFNAAWWGNKIPDNSLFELHDSVIKLYGGNVFCYPDDEKYCLTFFIHKNGKDAERIYLSNCSEELCGLDALNRPWGRIISDISL